MTKADLYAILAAIWIAPVNPDWVNLLIGGVILIAGAVSYIKDK